MVSQDYALVPSEKISEDTIDERDTFLQARESRKNKVLLVIIGLLIFVLVLSITGLIWLYKLAFSVSCLDPQAMSNARSGLLDSMSFFPPIPPTYTTFRDSEGNGFQDPGEVGDKLWHQASPLGHGYFALPHPRLYDVPTSMPLPNRTDSAEKYGTALTHNLHCLNSLRASIIKVSNGLPLREAVTAHLLHCVDYLRQGVECASDLTLEWYELQDDGEGNTWWAIPGDGAVHQCRDYSFVKKFLESIRLDDL